MSETESSGVNDEEKLEEVLDAIEVEDVPEDAPPLKEGFVEE